jgi:hypothetical protein
MRRSRCTVVASRTVRRLRRADSVGEETNKTVIVIERVPALAPFRIRSFRFQWPADLLASWAFEMEGVILGWFVLVSTGSVLALAVFGSLQFLGTLISPLFGMAGDRIGSRKLLCLMRSTYIVAALILAALFLLDRAKPRLGVCARHRHRAGASVGHHPAQHPGRRDHAQRAPDACDECLAHDGGLGAHRRAR